MVDSEIIARLIIAVVLNAPIGCIAAKLKSLSFPRGFLTAALISVSIYVLFPPGWVALILFFTSSSILSSISPITKKNAKSIQEKGACRDQYQILANSVIALIMSILYFMNNGVSFNLIDTFFVSVFVAFSSVTADTWGTEVGMIAKDEPRYILNPSRTVPTGTSGGITFLGTLASIAGSAMIAVLFVILATLNSMSNLYSLKIWIYCALILISGFLGQLIDSFMGATIQSTFKCTNCHALIEMDHHKHCDVKATRIKGIAGFNNDWVNFTSTAIVTVFFIIVTIIVPL